jgi:hypothetical protein
VIVNIIGKLEMGNRKRKDTFNDECQGKSPACDENVAASQCRGGARHGRDGRRRHGLQLPATTRALFAAYSGALYQVRRSSDNTTTNISPLSAGGVANAAAQDSFCAGTSCVITEIFDHRKVARSAR